MEIAALNVKVMFQKGTPVSDEIGNRANIWEDYFSCYATVSGEGGTENAVAGLTVENADCAFTVRWCRWMWLSVRDTGLSLPGRFTISFPSTI